MLKKCIVIMVMFTLITGATFALEVGGQLQEGLVLLSGSNVKDTDVNFGGEYTGDGPFHEAKISMLLGDGTAGARLVMNAKGSFWGWMQWRPNQYFRVKIGSDGDGEGGFAQIVGWGFTGEAKNSVAAVNDYNGTLAMSYRNTGLNYGAYGDAGNFHFMMSVFPVDMLSINFLFRDIDQQMEISERFARMQIYLSYKIEEIGTVRFAAVGNGGLAKEKDDYVAADHPEGKDVGNLHIAFYSNEIVQGLAFELGANINLPHSDAEEPVYSNINIAAGLNITGLTDPFNFKLRANFGFGGKELVKEKQKFADVDADGDPIEVEKTVVTGNKDVTAKLGLGILPSYKLPKMTIFLHAGMGFEFDKERDVTDDDGKPVKDAAGKTVTETFTDYNWFINPYIWVPMGGMRMWIGLQILDAHSVRDGQINWNIPMGFNFYF